MNICFLLKEGIHSFISSNDYLSSDCWHFGALQSEIEKFKNKIPEKISFNKHVDLAEWSFYRLKIYRHTCQLGKNWSCRNLVRVHRWGQLVYVWVEITQLVRKTKVSLTNQQYQQPPSSRGLSHSSPKFNRLSQIATMHRRKLFAISFFAVQAMPHTFDLS